MKSAALAIVFLLAPAGAQAGGSAYEVAVFTPTGHNVISTHFPESGYEEVLLFGTPDGRRLEVAPAADGMYVFWDDELIDDGSGTMRWRDSLWWSGLRPSTSPGKHIACTVYEDCLRALQRQRATRSEPRYVQYRPEDEYAQILVSEVWIGDQRVAAEEIRHLVWRDATGVELLFLTRRPLPLETPAEG